MSSYRSSSFPSAHTARSMSRSAAPATKTGLAIALLLAMSQLHAAPLEEVAAAAAARPGAAADATTLDALQVTANAGVTATAVDAKRRSSVLVDSIDQESIQVTSQENSIAQRLVVAPGVSLMRDEDQPRYVTVRGIAANLNSTTLDGITMASVGDEGGGERKINLQLIPNDIASRIDIFKTFSAEQNPDSIGAGINLVSGSAFDKPRNSLHVDASVNYHALGNDDGRNSLSQTTDRWGSGLSGSFSTTFGSSDQFGLTLSARNQDFQTSQNKLFQSSQQFFDSQGNYITGPLPAQGWNGMSAPNNFAYYADNRWIRTYGGSAKLQWMPSDSPFRASVLMYNYGMEERRTENGYEFITQRNVTGQTPVSGTKGIDSLNVIFENKVWARNNRGVLGGIEWEQDNQWLALRGGYTRDRINAHGRSTRLTAKPVGQSLTYASPGVGEIYNITGLSDPGIIDSARYDLNSASESQTYGTAEVRDVRLDHRWNVGPEARGFGIASGLEYKRLEVESNITRRNNVAGGDFSHYLYQPGFRYPKSQYALPFFDYHAFMGNGGWDALPVDQTGSTYSSLASDFRYLETVKNAYVSFHYSTDFLEALAGVRYDDTTFTAHTPAITAGVVTGTGRNGGGYDNLLPSLNLTAHLREDMNLRFSASKTIGRPIPSNIAQAEVVNCDGDSGDCSISRGNPDLKPQRSTNFDLSLEKYFNDGRGYASLAVFHKDISDNIAGITSESIDDQGRVTSINTPQNLEDSSVRGVELSLVNRDMALGEHRFDVLFNAAQMDGEMVYRWTGGERTIHQLASQPKTIANLGITWHMPWLNTSLTVSENYTGKHIFTIGANSWGDRGFRSRYVTDVSLKTRINDKWSVGLTAANLFGEDQYQTVGDNFEYMRNLNNYGPTYALHVSYELNP
ncbi:TonB-dependent receptor [Stenotrophomonas sp.]|uniref:TonB-dependent receptor n=1 Tax=Stenotrophomonas sp. TaxID=69392 RepID=UPI002898DFBC|nr:TonB-dependent receptor [Stenotrophomonas sp.]